MFAPSARLGRALCVAATAAAWSRGGAPRAVAVDPSRGGRRGALPTVEEAIAGAEGYDGPGIVDPYYMHPDTYPMLHDWTAERFDCDLESGGYAEWVIRGGARRGSSRTAKSRALRRTLHLDHLFWARESAIVADRDGGPRVYAAQAAQDDRGDAVAPVVAVVGGDAARRALVAADPLVRAGVFDEARSGAYHWTIAGDPYLQADVWPDGEPVPPPQARRLTRANAGATREKHLSFLRKTRRTMRAGPLRPLGDAAGAPVGSLVYAFHASRGAALDWAAADPYVDAGVFGDGVQPLAAATYCELDVTGTQLTRPPPLNELPDPLLQRLVDADLVTLEERQVQRIEADPKTGEFVRYNITTTDPRVLSNVDVDDGLMATLADGASPRRRPAKKRLGGGRLAALSGAEGDDAAENDDGDLPDES
ncbi:hypothetical protein JL720_16984 [Aureococcus anophagefferens]|nr:hypothetical protein JL720_16984 [Aureococcus anophagefferens]